MAEEITLKSFPFDSVNVLNEESGQMEPDREYEAEIFRKYFAKFLSNGVYFGDYKNYKENSMKVSTDGGLTIKVATGAGIIEGADFENEEERVFTLERPVSGERIDRVVVRFDKTLSQRNTYLLVKKGDGTTAPAIQRDDNIHEICIAEITINSTSNLSSDSIADTRLNKDLCGIVNSLITVDGEELYQRFEANIQKIEQEFQEYVDNTKENFTSREETYLKEETYNKTEIDGKVDTKAPTSHASSGTTYGVGTTSDYGHCKVANNLNNSSFADGVALAAYQGFVLKNLIETLKNIVSGNYSTLNNKFGNYLPLSGGHITGSLYAKYLNTQGENMNTAGGNLYTEGGKIDTSTGNIQSSTGNISTGTGSIKTDTGDIKTGTGKIQTDTGDIIAGGTLKGSGIQSEEIYDGETVTNSPNMYITSNGNVRRTSGSSERWKKDITEVIEERLNPEALYNLKVKQFKYEEGCISKEDVRYGKNILGFIAEDVAEIYEPAVQYDEKGQVEMWNAQIMIPALLKLIQNQHKDIQELKSRISKLEENEV